MTRSCNQAGLNLIKRRESLCLVACEDKLKPGIWQIGYCHTEGVKQGMVTDEPGAEVLLRKDALWAEATVEGCVTVPLTDNQFSALVALCYNIGASAFRNSRTLLSLLNNGHYDGASSYILQFDHYRDRNGVLRESNGLENRCVEERALFLTPDESAA